MGGFEISTAGLRRSSDGMIEVVDRLITALTGLESTLQGFGSPWGSGLIGSAVGTVYQEIHDMAMSSYEANAETMSEYADRLEGLADDLDAIEAEIESGFELFQQRLGDSFRGAAP